ncbi:ribosome maturation factor RimM [Granulicoccus phenolivorans]|uniref:ribosome maturation factor RimM n=1 Tax=Granulicoccus phenolivorans TaxID=266854 RepID=UPI0003FF263D|nr:ribosome maturation factor RimM [Granulicoccus phenolivorans]
MSDIDVIVGRIGRAHGIRGDLLVEPLTDEPDRRFAPGQKLTEDGGPRSWTVRDSRWHSGKLVVSLVEVADRTAAEALRGVRVAARVPAEQTPEDAEEYYDRHLIGLTVLSAGTPRGTVAGVLHQAQDLLEIRMSDGATRLVPFVAALVPEVDLAAGTVTVADLPGLLADEPDEPGDGDAPA